MPVKSQFAPGKVRGRKMRRCDDATINSYRDIKKVYVLIIITLLFLLLLYEINGRIVASSHQKHSG